MTDMNKVTKFRVSLLEFILIEALLYIYLVNWDTDYYRLSKFKNTALFTICFCFLFLISSYFVKPKEDKTKNE